jgi:GDP-L-fucose synthase
MRKMHDAKLQGAPNVEIWGSGTPKREFLHCDDLADACLFLLEGYSAPGPINVGSGTDLSIRELAEMVREVVGFEGELAFDASKPDGTPRKLMDVSKLERAGWQAKIGLRDGIESTYQWFLENVEALPERVHN